MAKKHPYKYEEADKVIVFNTNPYFPQQELELAPIEYVIPVECPPLETIDGYGLPPADQYFDAYRHLHKMPKKLRDLNKRNNLTDSQKCEEIENNPEYYAEEIEWIKLQWKRRWEGYHFFNNGKVTYITDHHYFFMLFYKMEGKRAKFRMLDREDFLFLMLCERDPKCYGDNLPKKRREGATHRRCAKRLNNATRKPYWKSGMQSKDEDHAEEIFEENILSNFQDLPFFFKPVWNNDHRSKSSIKMTAPTAMNHPDYGRTDTLKSKLDYKNSSVKAYDGVPLDELHNDECGKTTEVDVYQRWKTQKFCFLDNGVIREGKASNTSTVSEMTREGGLNFKRLCDHSHYHKPQVGKTTEDVPIPGRDETGSTISGLYNHFTPGFEGYNIEGEAPCIDKYGFTDTARTFAYLKNKLDRLKEAGDVSAYLEERRLVPLQWSDCWIISAKDCNFNLAIIEDRLNYFRYNPNHLKVRGNFQWVDGIRDGKVEFIPCENGRWWVSYQFDNWEQDANRKYQENSVWFPDPIMAAKFKSGGDPYLSKQKSGPAAVKNKRSNGGGAAFMCRDRSIDPDDKPTSQWKTHRFVATYSYRHPSQELYGEDMIMQCVYYGSPMNAENNVEFLVKYFIQRGYAGYLHYGLTKKGEVNNEAGSNTNNKSTDDMYKALETYVQWHFHREVHDEVIQDCKDLADSFTPFDRLVACAKALIAATQVDSFADRRLNTYEINTFFKNQELAEY